MESKINGICSSHKNQILRFICFDKSCPLEGLCCVFCIMEVHNTCKEDHIIDVDKIKERFLIKKPGNNKRLKIHFEDMINTKIMNLFREIEIEKKKVLACFEDPNENLEQLRGEDINNLKKFYDIEFDEKTNKIIFQNPINSENQNLKEDIARFKRLVNKDLSKFSTYIFKSAIYRSVKKNIIKNFDVHQDIKPKPYFNGIKFKVTGNSSNSPLIILKEPLQDFRVQITYKKKYFNQNFRIGIMSQNDYLGIQKNLTFPEKKLKQYYGVQKSRLINMDGYSPVIRGHLPVITENDFQDFSDRYCIFLDFNKEKGILNIWNSEDEKIATQNNISKDMRFYLYMGIEGKGTKIVFEKLR